MVKLLHLLLDQALFKVKRNCTKRTSQMKRQVRRKVENNSSVEIELVEIIDNKDSVGKELGKRAKKKIPSLHGGCFAVCILNM